jgi:hypothetical protein
VEGILLWYMSSGKTFDHPDPLPPTVEAASKVGTIQVLLLSYDYSEHDDVRSSEPGAESRQASSHASHTHTHTSTHAYTVRLEVT